MRVPCYSSFSWQSPLPIKISGYLTYNEQHQRVNNASILVDYAYQNVTVGIVNAYRRINSEFAEALDLTESPSQDSFTSRNGGFHASTIR